MSARETSDSEERTGMCCTAMREQLVAEVSKASEATPNV